MWELSFFSFIHKCDANIYRMLMWSSWKRPTIRYFIVRKNFPIFGIFSFSIYCAARGLLFDIMPTVVVSAAVNSTFTIFFFWIHIKFTMDVQFTDKRQYGVCVFSLGISRRNNYCLLHFLPNTSFFHTFDLF